MDVIRNIGITVVLVVLFDWLFFTRTGNYFPNFDYRYWPLSKARLISLLVVMCTMVWLFVFVPPNPTNPPTWALIPFVLVLVGHVVVGFRAIAAQRRAGYREPPRYSDDDY